MCEYKVNYLSNYDHYFPRYDIVEPEDQKWGSLDSDNPKVFNGMIGQLQREVCDFVYACTSK